MLSQWALLLAKLSNLQLNSKCTKTIPCHTFEISYSNGSVAIHLHLCHVHINSIISARYLKGFELTVILSTIFATKMAQFQSF